MKTTQFFTDILRANLRNPQWSWGAVDPMTNRVYLRVWEDDIQSIEDGERALLVSDEWRHLSKSKNGLRERDRHIAAIREGATGFGVLCTAVAPRPTEPRKIASFDDTIVLQLGVITEDNGRTYAHIDARIPVKEVMRQRTGQSTIIQDLKTLERRKIDSTTKDALVSARVGQDVFRSRVLQLWHNRCSVTGSKTLEAIRASHIKPWRFASDEERLDPGNGLPLIAGLDALFDAGLISFEASGALVVSPLLSERERQIFGIQSLSLAETPSERTAQYLAYHHDQIFRK